MRAQLRGVSDPVVAPDLAEDDWRDIRQDHSATRRQVRGALLTCVDCHQPMHPKQTHRGVRFFAHNPNALVDCALRELDGESPEHRSLKVSIYRAAKKVKGWNAEMEVKGSELDPVTGRPVIVDVVANQVSGRGFDPFNPPRDGWEIQRSAMDVGTALERHSRRERWLRRCTWVTKQRKAWSDEIPWYQVAQPEGAPPLVVDGVSREVRASQTWRDVDYERAEVFPNDQMVRYVLRRRATWIDRLGYILDYGQAGSPRVVRSDRRSVQGQVAQFCDRLAEVPEEMRDWTDEQWHRYALGAVTRERRGLLLSAVDRYALQRFPAEDPDDGEDREVSRIVMPDYFPDDKQICIECGGSLIVSCMADVPLHHRCAWAIRARL